MLIDVYLPTYDVRERHHTRVAAPIDVTYDALRSADLGSAPLARMLMALRALPGALAHGPAGVRALSARAPEPITLATFEERGFRVLEEAPPVELVIGLEGQFWRASGNLRTPPPESFRGEPPAPGTARAAWNFHLSDQPDGTTELTTETRVHCADAAARRRFLPYWYLIRPASGFIRHTMLRAIREAAEGHDVPADR